MNIRHACYRGIILSAFGWLTISNISKADEFTCIVQFSDGHPCAFARLVIALHAEPFQLFRTFDPNWGDPVRPVRAIVKKDGSIVKVASDETGRIVVECNDITEVRIFPLVDLPLYRDKIYDTDIDALLVTKYSNAKWIVHYPDDAKYIRCHNQEKWYVYRLAYMITSNRTQSDYWTHDSGIREEVTQIHKQIQVPLPYVSRKWSVPIISSVGGQKGRGAEYKWKSDIQVCLRNALTGEAKMYWLSAEKDIGGTQGSYAIDIDNLATKPVDDIGHIVETN